MSLFGNIGLRGNNSGDNEAPKSKKNWQLLNNKNEEEEKKSAEPSYWESIK